MAATTVRQRHRDRRQAESGEGQPSGQGMEEELHQGHGGDAAQRAFDLAPGQAQTEGEEGRRPGRAAEKGGEGAERAGQADFGCREQHADGDGDQKGIGDRPDEGLPHHGQKTAGAARRFQKGHRERQQHDEIDHQGRCQRAGRRFAEGRQHQGQGEKAQVSDRTGLAEDGHVAQPSAEEKAGQQCAEEKDGQPGGEPSEQEILIEHD